MGLGLYSDGLRAGFPHTSDPREKTPVCIARALLLCHPACQARITDPGETRRTSGFRTHVKFLTSKSSRGCGEFVQALQERIRRLVPDDPHHFVALRIEEDDARRPEQPEALEQRLIVGIIRRDVSAQQVELRQARTYPRIAEREMFHLLARHAPVRVEIEHGRTAGGLERQIQFRRRSYRGEGFPRRGLGLRASLCSGTHARSKYGEWTQWIGGARGKPNEQCSAPDSERGAESTTQLAPYRQRRSTRCKEPQRRSCYEQPQRRQSHLRDRT